MDGSHSVDIFWGVVWFIVFLLATISCIKCFKVNGWRLPVTTGFFILLGSFLKVLGAGLSFLDTDSYQVEIILSILKNLPTFTLLASFLLVVLFWISTYHDPDTVTKRKGICSKLVIPIYLTIISIHLLMLILVGVSQGYRSYLVFYQSTRFFTRMYSIIMSISFSASFLIYGFLVGRQHNNSFQFYSCALVLGLSFLANGINIFIVSFIIPIVNYSQTIIVISVDNLIDCLISLEILYLIYIDTKANIVRLQKILERSPSNLSDVYLHQTVSETNSRRSSIDSNISNVSFKDQKSETSIV